VDLSEYNTPRVTDEYISTIIDHTVKITHHQILINALKMICWRFL